MDDRETRRKQRLRQLGSRNPSCRICGESDPFTLTGTSPEIYCYQCRRLTEHHHVAGRHNDELTVPLLGNDHRVANDLMLDWPRETLLNPDGSPLLRAAAMIRGWLILLRIVIERGMGWIPPFLEMVDRRLVREMGPRWWSRIQEEDQQ